MKWVEVKCGFDLVDNGGRIIGSTRKPFIPKLDAYPWYAAINTEDDTLGIIGYFAFEKAARIATEGLLGASIQ